MSDLHICDVCGVEADEEDLSLCALSTSWAPLHECVDCVRECSPCQSEAAHEFQAEVRADLARFGF